MLIVFALLLAAQSVPDTAALASAYLDPGARALVSGARAARDTVDRSLLGYRAFVRERVAGDLRAARRDRRLYGRELALRVEWRRDGPGRIEVVGARERAPVVGPDERIPDYLERAAPRTVFDPTDDRLIIWDDSGYVRHPLAPGSEAHYRFASGDTTVIALPTGEPLRLVELRVIPRLGDSRLMTGALWIETRGHAVVRAVVRPAAPLRIRVDGPLAWLVPATSFEVRVAALEYVLWDRRWWMLRRVALEAVAVVGTWFEVPLHYERELDDYEIDVDSAAGPVLRSEVAVAEPDTAPPRFEIVLPADTAAVLTSALLPEPVPGGADTSLTGRDLERVARELERLAVVPRPLGIRPPRWVLARYNRVEGLSLGARLELDAVARFDVTARLGLADLDPELEVGAGSRVAGMWAHLAAYRRLAVVDPATRGLGTGNSLSALLLGRDDGDYYRATGTELALEPEVTRPQKFRLRVYAERQRGVGKETDVSLRRLLASDHRFRANIDATAADQVGASASFRASRGALGAEVGIDAAAGTFDFLRATLIMRATAARPGALAGALEVAGGTSAGRLAPQHLWSLGGPQTLRGYAGGAIRGEEYWRARIEAGTSGPAVRLTVFADAGRAAPRGALSLRHPLLSSGIGVSLLDGLLRIDLARALRPPTGWRLDLYADGLI